MEIRSQLVWFLCDLPEFATSRERMVVIDYIGLGFTPIRHKINWEGSPFTFVNNLLTTLAEEGRETLISFLKSLEETDFFWGVEKREKLANLRMSIEALTQNQYEVEFGIPKSGFNLKRPIEVFYSYAHKDERLRNKLETQLSLLKQQGHISNWHDRKISAGQEWANEINDHLNTADIILLLVSPDFLASDYCYGIEMKRALERHERGEARVIPIILRKVYWQEAPFGKLQAFPTDGKPVTSAGWHNQDEAFFNVAEGIRKVVEEMRKRV